MMEPAELPEMRPLAEEAPCWAITGAKGRPHNVISSLYMGADELVLNVELQAKLRTIESAGEVRYETAHIDDAEIVIVAFGTAARRGPHGRQPVASRRRARWPLPADYPVALPRT